jgi:hypothetical protein
MCVEEGFGAKNSIVFCAVYSAHPASSSWKIDWRVDYCVKKEIYSSHHYDL